MKKLFVFILTAALLATPVFASAGPDSRSADPAVCSHHFEVSVVKPSTCSQKGLLAYTCSKCGLTYTAETLPNGEHNYELTDTTATCTEDGEATYTCSYCGDTYTEPAPATGHVPSGEPADCAQGVVCTVCGQTLEPPVGHKYAYQYDAEFDENGDPTYYGTWKCANCGSVLPATLGNVMYYYQLDESAQAPETPEDSSGTDLTLAGGEDYEDSSPADTEPAAREIPVQEQTETEQELPREQTEEATEAEQTEETDDGRTGLWIAVSAGALVFIVIETVFLVRSLKKSKTTI